MCAEQHSALLAGLTRLAQGGVHVHKVVSVYYSNALPCHRACFAVFHDTLPCRSTTTE